MGSIRINNLKKYRQRAGYTQKDVARILDYTYTTGISKWEKGFLLPCTKHLFILSHLYNALPNELFPVLWESLKQEAAEKKMCFSLKKKIIENQHFYL